MSRRSYLLVFAALAAPIAATSIARGDDRGATTPSGSASEGPRGATPAPSAAPTAPASTAPAAPATGANARPPLVAPQATPSPAATPAPPPTPTPATVTPGSAGQNLQEPPASREVKPVDTGEIGGNPREVFSDDWWGRVHPVVELHGYFRTRAALFQNLDLGRRASYLFGTDPQYLQPAPLDSSYSNAVGTGQTTVALCGSASPPTAACNDKTESGANMRLRLDPEIHISDNLRIVSEIFALDNVVLGSTPDAYAMEPTQTASGAPTTAGAPRPPAYQSAGYNPYASAAFFTNTQGPPTAGINSLQNSVSVQRVWGEYMTPVGQLRFGRMPGQWGLGMVENSGDGIDSDYQTTLDRIMFISGIKSMDLYFGGAWDFVSTGPTTANAYSIYGGQPYNTCNLCNVNEWAVFAAHRRNPELQRLDLSRGDLVVNGGLYAKFRSQYLDVADGTTPLTIPYNSSDMTGNNSGLDYRQAWQLTPDLWVQLLWRKFRFEAEAAMNYGEIGHLAPLAAVPNNTADIRQYGVVTETEFKAVEDKLDLQFGFGWSSGDQWAFNPGQGGTGQNALAPGATTPNEYNGIGPLSTFRFNPDYRVDLLFFRNILTRVEGSYYFRPSVAYDFLHHANGEKFGGGAAVIWSRASEFVQTPGHHRDLGVELDLRLYYQSKDGSLNDDPTKVGGFYTMLEYGVFFPLAGLDYLPTNGSTTESGLSTAQIARLFLGIAF